MIKINRVTKRNIVIIGVVALLIAIQMAFITQTVFANSQGAGQVSSVIEKSWGEASSQIKTVVNNVVFPAIDLVLAVFFFIKLGVAYFDYRKTGQFEWVGPAILFACLIFMLSAPTYVWQILGI